MAIDPRIDEVAEDCVPRDLAGYQLVKMTEVYRVNDDGVKIKSLGFFRRAEVAEAFRGAQTDANWHKTCEKLLLTNGIYAFVVKQSQVTLFDDEHEALRLREHALSKLTDAERSLLGFDKKPFA